MCIARHKAVLGLLTAALKRIKELLYSPGYITYIVKRKELEVDKHLIVTRASAMDLLAYIAEACRKQKLHL